MLNARFPALLFANGLGDHFLSLPAVRALVHLFPRRMALICQTGARSLFFNHIEFRLTCELSMTVTDDGRVFDADRAAAVVAPCDLLISLNPWHSTSIERLLNRMAPRASIGFSPKFRHHIKLDYSRHSAEAAFDIPRAIQHSLVLDDFSEPPSFASCFVEQARRVRCLIPAKFRILAVHADTIPRKMWPREKFVRLINMFLEQRPDFVAIVLGLTDMKLDRGQYRDRIIPVYQLPLPTSALLVGWSDLFVGIDSSMLHVADLFRVPGVGIFGPTNPNEWGFRFGSHRHLRAHGRTSNLDETAVLHALTDLLAETQIRRTRRRRDNKTIDCFQY